MAPLLLVMAVLLPAGRGQQRSHCPEDHRRTRARPHSFPYMALFRSRLEWVHHFVEDSWCEKTLSDSGSLLGK
ncbi:hypothetical protein Cadr_000005820 [Camelus dromedarius]|uniref:Uncharacterized protein n=1 Tax=Camelus dromedarius TaxID=9838 RepID=A0A5N4E3V9_CAMDR|nr:hypothetical protein Cadr_000005820 [Camelus dromedarius]